MLESRPDPAPGPCVRIGRVLGLLLLSACTLEAGSTGAPGAPNPEPPGEEPAQSELDATSALVAEEGGVQPELDASGSVGPDRLDASSPRDGSTSTPPTDAQPVPEAALDAMLVVDASDAGAAMDGRDAASALDTSLPADAEPRVDAEPPVDASTPDDAQAPDSGSGPPRCSLQGSFAAEIVFNVQWRGTTLAGFVPVIAAGSGTVRIVARMDSVESAGKTSTMFAACGGYVPDFAASWLTGEVYSVEIPDRIWDQPTIPRWSMGWDYVCKAPGCTLRSQPVVATLGARAAAGDTWPGRTGAISQITPVDHDNDMLTGLTLIPRGPDKRNPAGKAYDEPPISWTQGSRASKLFSAFQLSGRLDGTFAGCDSFAGSVADGRVEARALGCIAHREGDTTEFACSRSNTEFLDENFPHWVVTGGSVRARRIAPELSCKEIRALWQ